MCLTTFRDCRYKLFQVFMRSQFFFVSLKAVKSLIDKLGDFCNKVNLAREIKVAKGEACYAAAEIIR
ncbi:hypothetical protein MT325_m774R [Paramecium bursaria chlorella virus MT325]|uniref:Uncharacterized protein m774R n=1 Tax=Paramecium bursaria Chlorella virus MT325 TaxID=346932 RepID=A7IVF4_PBCVM|nr:hypothetical protein MT325_m774R [Paramecium bursaria chlorella virus MT325]